MGMPLQEITIPILVLSDENAFPKPLLAAALSHSRNLQYQTYPEFAAFEGGQGGTRAGLIPAGLPDARLSSQMVDFIAWNERINPYLVCDRKPVEMAPEEIYLAGVCF
jgi:hypothetical protein